MTQIKSMKFYFLTSNKKEVLLLISFVLNIWACEVLKGEFLKQQWDRIQPKIGSYLERKITQEVKKYHVCQKFPSSAPDVLLFRFFPSAFFVWLFVCFSSCLRPFSCHWSVTYCDHDIVLIMLPPRLSQIVLFCIPCFLVLSLLIEAYPCWNVWLWLLDLL